MALLKLIFYLIRLDANAGSVSTGCCLRQCLEKHWGTTVFSEACCFCTTWNIHFCTLHKTIGMEISISFFVFLFLNERQIQAFTKYSCSQMLMQSIVTSFNLVMQIMHGYALIFWKFCAIWLREALQNLFDHCLNILWRIALKCCYLGWPMLMYCFFFTLFSSLCFCLFIELFWLIIYLQNSRHHIIFSNTKFLLWFFLWYWKTLLLVAFCFLFGMLTLPFC